MNPLLSLTLACLIALVLTQSCAPSFSNDQILTGTPSLTQAPTPSSSTASDYSVTTLHLPPPPPPHSNSPTVL